MRSGSGRESRRAARSSLGGTVRVETMRRRSRSRILSRARSGPDPLLLAVAALALAVLAIGIWVAAQRPGTETAEGATASPSAAPRTFGVTAENRLEPTPFFGRYGELRLYLPISPEDLTEIAYHQASRAYALPMVSLLPDADMTAAAANHGTGRHEIAHATPSRDSDGDRGFVVATADGPVLAGEVLRMWRSNRTGMPDTAVDVAAAAGTTVFAPVTGEVIEVRPYRLYEKCDDFEIHIRPWGFDDIDLVIIHVDEVDVRAGDRVVGGVSAIAKVRLLSDRVTHQISAYTPDGGDHVHVQLNRVGDETHTSDGS